MSIKAGIILFIMSVFLVNNPLFSQTTGSQQVIKARIDAHLTQGVANGFSGAVLVSKGEKILINKGYGLADKDKQLLNSPSTIFDIGSNTKQFTGAAVLKLVQYKKLSISDPIVKFFPDLPEDKQGITLYHLLTHSAGFVESIGRDFDKISTEEFFKTLFQSDLLFEPGSKYSYSNTGYSVLARIIELVSDQTYEAFLNEHLFQPAGMNHTGYLLPEWDAKNLSRGYNRNVMDVGSMVMRYKEDGEISWHLKGNGGINSTQDDMSKWLNALERHEILPEPLFQEFIKPRIGPTNGSFEYAFGWGVKTTDRNTTRLSHNGSNGAFAHTILWLPEEDIKIIYATNANSPLVERLAYTVMDMLFKEDFHPEPIEKNVYYLIREYALSNPPDQINALVDQLKTNHKSYIENPGTLNRMGYLLLRNDNKPLWAVELFKFNSELFPDNWNIWDSLGDGYAAAGENKSAIDSYRKAVKLGSDESQEKIESLLKTNK